MTAESRGAQLKPKILVTRAVFQEVIDHLSQYFDVDSNQSDEVFSEAELIRRLQGKAGVYANPTNLMSAEVIRSAVELRAICNMAVGYNNIDVAAATAAGIMVTNTPDVLNETTADFGWTLLMATARRVTESEHYLRAGLWKKWMYDSFMGVDVHGSTLGIIGMGRIGRSVARRSMGFNMKVIYNNRSRLAPELEAEANNARHVSREELLRSADHVVLVLPYSKESHHLIGAAELALMKPTATLINIARGGIVDDAALIDALSAGKIAAAGLDVFENEPAFNPGFLKLSNVVLTPHIGSASGLTRRAMADCAADNLIAALSGHRPPNLLNPESFK
ncbi:LdhA Lactate dehydrogenase and related dehydrogenases [Oxalobacteraceae bacterium]